MKLYELSWGVYPRRVIIYLAEKGISHLERIPVDLVRGENRQSEHLARNPAGTVPVLAISEDVFIRQSTSILEYLEELYPQPNMIGETPADRAFTRDLMSLINESTLLFGVHISHANRLFAGRVAQKSDAADAAWGFYRQRMTTVDQMVKSDEFLNGMHPTIADCALASLVGFANDLYNVPIPSDCGQITAWYARFSARPSATAPAYPPELLALAHSR
jgi:glutathione S-transferase